jgi:opacity protein-like surface antigen
MKTRLFLTMAFALALFTTAAFAADVSGKWTAETKGRDGETRTQTFNFKQDGSKLTGSVSNPMGDREISEGKVDGDNISFVMKFERDGNEMKIPYTGKVVGNEIQFKTESPRGTREFTAKKSST